MYPNPQQYPPGGPQQFAYQGPPPKKSGPGCWLWVPLGCFGVFFIIGIAGYVAMRSIATGPGAKSFTQAFGGAMQGGMEIAEASKNLRLINTAVNSFQRDHGTYPSNLGQLVPTYLPSSSVLHNSADPNPNPNHVSYTYVKPTSSTAQNVPYLSTSVTYSMTIQNQTITQTEVMKMALDGTVTQQQTQTQTTSGASGTNSGKGF
jgi:hypothetical protein